MVKFKINGISIDMPYKPYPSQIVTISKLLTSFQTSTSALIESPTGTGKSFSIICSIMAYQSSLIRDSNIKKSKIFICTRTHSQINQLVEQLRKTIYKPRITILGSKNQYCIHPKVIKTIDKNTGCMELLKMNKCIYFQRKDKLVNRAGDIIFDIEELRSLGINCIGCPYYASRLMMENADIIFAPYNYLINAKIRSNLDICLENAIILIDEAHNIEDVCRTAGSIELTSRIIDIIIIELNNLLSVNIREKDSKEIINKIIHTFDKLKIGADKKIFKDDNNYTMIKKGHNIITEFENLGITINDIMEIEILIQNDNLNKMSILSLTSIRLLQEFVDIFKIIKQGAESFVFCFQKFNNQNKNFKIMNNLSECDKYVYNLWLLDPGVIFKSVVSMARSVCLLSGTLTPFESFYSELKHTFSQQICAPHILKNEQVFVANIQNGHLGMQLCGTYKIVMSEIYLEQILKIIEDVATRFSNAGTLVFVPSYTFLNKLSDRIKNALIEPRSGNKKFTEVIKTYQERVKSGKGAIFCCVYRGKASEGINFQDEYARAVIAIGIPFPSIKDPQIYLKKEYNDNNSTNFNGRMWYEAQAYRAINQAVGRIIRHANDWGAVFLLDSRFSSQKSRDLMSSWISNNLKIYSKYTDLKKDLNNFVSLYKTLN